MLFIFVTFDVFIEEMSWLNDENMQLISITFDKFHKEMYDLVLQNMLAYLELWKRCLG